VPAEAYAEFKKSADRGAEAHKAWEATRAAYAEKYPEEYAEFESIMTGKLPANWAEKLPKFTSEGEWARVGGGEGWAERVGGGLAALYWWGPAGSSSLL
jgi:transketolase